MEIRPLNKLDETEIAKALQVQKAAYEIEAKLLKVTNFPPLKETVDDLRTSNDETHIAILNHQITGMISLEKNKDFILISKLVVDPTAFRKGIGKGLILHALSLYPKTEFQVSTGKENIPALRLYSNFAFEIFQERQIDGIEIVILRRPET